MTPSKTNEFQGRHALITGSTSGIGLGIAMALAEQGCHLTLNGLGDAEDIARLCREMAQDHLVEVEYSPADMRRPDEIADMVAEAEKRFDGLDILINNAGIQGYEPLHEMEVETFQRFQQVHVLGSFLTTRAVWPHMMEQGSGRVVMTGSVGMFGPESAAHYAAAKGGVFGLMRAASVEGQAHGIAVNGVVPAAATPAVDELGAQDTEMLAGRFDPSPDLVSPVVAWLAHEQCPASGELFHAGFGWVGRVIAGQGPGYADPDLSAEAVRDHWDEICAATPVTAISSTHEGLEALMRCAPNKDG